MTEVGVTQNTGEAQPTNTEVGGWDMRKAWEESKDQPLTDSQQGNRTCPARN